MMHDSFRRMAHIRARMALVNRQIARRRLEPLLAIDSSASFFEVDAPARMQGIRSRLLLPTAPEHVWGFP